MRNFSFITVTATGNSLTTGAASNGGNLPNASTGQIPRFVRFASTANARIRIGVGAQTALATDILVTPAEAVILAVPNGYTSWAAIQDTAAGAVCATPLEDV